ncbi:inhibitor of apoptosis protein-like isoform X2 [Physella acuta]|uniref:inhibitor of apoptosis protein-like isoform X1 n=1 Tax=Physella acuta TaxID=109671 RepID=UPI0027DDD05C|nr:inhibitor of apoptosis protein-like isoform X1 [Physella acuta]XP_059160176.1 inhibitor of apoptosis protein-like isoform X2 [Physella acuta]
MAKSAHNDVKLHPTQVAGVLWVKFKQEMYRLATFSTYPTSSMKSALLLARDGFVYIGTGKDDDLVICGFCCATKKEWSFSDDVTEVHRQMSPNCSLVNGSPCENIPLECTATNTRILQSMIESNEGIELDAAMFPSHPTTLQIENQISNSLREYPEIAEVRRNEEDTALINEDRNSPRTNHSTQLIPSRTVTRENTTTEEISTEQPADLYIENRTSTAASPAQSTTSSAPLATISTTPPRTTQNEANTTPTGNTTQPQSANQNSRRNGRNPTYAELGIITERPKRLDYALKVKRLESLSAWPSRHHLVKEDLAEAGFYYGGYGDCARCFYCGGGLRNWEDEDDVWVEHARWFPKCAYIRQTMGQVFVDTVQELNREFDQISFAMVTNKIGSAHLSFHTDPSTNPLSRDAAVRTVVELGYVLDDVVGAAQRIKEDGAQISSDTIIERLAKDGKRSSRQSTERSATAGTSTESAAYKESLSRIKERNNQLRQQTVCKICMDREVAVVFLPCGHLVSCSDCAAAMKDCPVCRKVVKGTVRAFIG